MRSLAIFLLAFLPAVITAQHRYNAALLDTLEQMSAGNSPARHFARLYHRAIEATNVYAKTQSEEIRQFIFGFEASFAPGFFQSERNFVGGKPQLPCWQAYYSDTGLNTLQYQFMGMNAHINGDMWLALKERHSYDSIKKYRGSLIRFQRALNVFFDSMYTASAGYKKIRMLHTLSLGTDRIVGKKIILHWRKRQVRMALLYYSDPEKCRRKQRRLENKMDRWNRFALRWIK
ncbi:DUF5995 family protein [Ferruginibacter sp.]